MADLNDKPTLTALHQQERRIEAQLAQAAQNATNTAVQINQRLGAQDKAQAELDTRLASIERTLARLTAVEKRNIGLDQRMKNIGFRLTDDIGENRRERGVLTSRVESLEGAYEWVKHRLTGEQAADTQRLDALHTAVTALQNAPPPDLAPLKEQLDSIATAVDALTAHANTLAPADSLTAVSNATSESLARLREELTALEHRQAQHTGRIDLLAQAQVTTEHDIERTHALAHRALMRPGTLAAPFTIPAHLQDTTIHINTHPGGRIFQPAQFVRIGPAVGQLRDPSTDDHGNEVWTFKAFTKQGAGATFTEGTAVELIGNRADATPYFD